MFKQTLSVVLIAALLGSSLPVRAFAEDAVKPGVGPADFPKEVKLQIDYLNAQPRSEEFRTPWTSKSPDGGYQIKMIGTKFAMVYDPNGLPIAVFDLTLNPLDWKQILMGGISFGDLSLLKLVRHIKESHKASKRGDDINAHQSSDEAAAAEAGAELADNQDQVTVDAELEQVANNAPAEAGDKDAIKAGMSYMKDVRLTADWAERNGVKDTDKAEGVPFHMGSFTLADLQFPAKVRSKALKPFILLASILYPEDKWDEKNVIEFMSEFEFTLNKQKPGYDIVWKKKKKKAPALPGVVANFVNPWQNLIYKANLHNYDQYGETLIHYLGIYGVLADLVLSRVCHGLQERLDYHERQFKGLLEEAEQFNYDLGIPLDQVNAMINQVYLSKWTGTGDSNLVNGPGKRKDERKLHESNHGKAMKRLLKKHKELQYTEIGSGKFAVATRGAAGSDAREFAGIYSLALKPTKFLKRPSLHVNAKTPAFKLTERYTADLAGWLARVILPANPAVLLGPVVVSVRIPPAAYEYWIRMRSLDETQMEGELAGLVDEALAGRYKLPLTQGQLQYTQSHLRLIQLNPYELSLKEEPAVIQANLEVLKKAASGSAASEQFRAEKMVPFVM